jgi:uncharacterized membrane protein
MTPNFTAMLLGSLLYGIIILAYIRWRFGLADALVFMLLAGGFTALLDFLNAFVAKTYEYPGQSALWVFTFIFFGWIGVCGSCLFVAEGILSHAGQDLLAPGSLWWQAPLLTSAIAVLLDLFIDPIAVAAGYWIWFVKGTVYYQIPLLNFVGWLVLMFLASLAWILIARQRQRGVWWKVPAALGALLPLSLGAILLSLLLNGIVAALGLR